MCDEKRGRNSVTNKFSIEITSTARQCALEIILYNIVYVYCMQSIGLPTAVTMTNTRIGVGWGRCGEVELRTVQGEG